MGNITSGDLRAALIKKILESARSATRCLYILTPTPFDDQTTRDGHAMMAQKLADIERDLLVLEAVESSPARLAPPS